MRRNNLEFSGRSAASKYILRAIQPLRALTDYNIAGPLNALLKPIQALDQQSEWGRRHVQLTRHPSLLEGFSLNRTTPLTAVLRTSFDFSLSRSERKARVVVPALVPGINFFPVNYFPYYSLIITLGIIPDIFYTEGKYQPPTPEYTQLYCELVATAWLPPVLSS